MTYSFDWKYSDTELPVDNWDSLVCTSAGHIYEAYHHNDKWIETGNIANEIDDVIAYVYFKDIPRPRNQRITNDAWIALVAKKGMLK